MISQELALDNLCTQGFHIEDNFLNTQDNEALKALIKNLQDTGQFSRAKIGIQNTAQHNESVRSDITCWVDEYSENPELREYVKKIQNLKTFFNEHLFLSLAEIEMHCAIYKPGAFYKLHCDQFATTKNRKISFVYYLNINWKKEDGGTLILYSQGGEKIQEVSPLNNRFICFNSELPHEVLVSHKTRYSLTGWMKTRK